MADTSTEELSKFFEDILKNKELIIEMVNTNVLMYDEKIKANKEKITKLKEFHEKMVAENQSTETKLKSEYSKYHEQLQKHEINYKLLDRTAAHYKSLIKEREDEIRKFEEQAIYCYQDYQNKKVKLDCLNVQIVEAEFQLKNLQKLMDEKINSLVGPAKTDNNFQNISLESNNTQPTQSTENKENKVEPPRKSKSNITISQERESESVAPKKRRTNVFGEVIEEKEEKLLSSYSEENSKSNDLINVKKNKNCLIY